MMRAMVKRIMARTANDDYIGHDASHERDALSGVIRLTNYGADISLSDGRHTSFWQYAISLPAEQAAMGWALKHGASIVTVERDCLTDSVDRVALGASSVSDLR